MIDAHQHFWRIGAHGCQWPTPDLAIYRDYLPQDLAPLVHENGISGTVLVQSQESDADTDFLLALAAQSPLVKGVVGWVDMASPLAEARIEALAKNPKLRGLRPMLQGLAEDSWILNPQLEPALSAMKASGLSLDALVYTRHLPYLRIFARRHPSLPIVIDHGAKPAIGGDEFATWAGAMEAMAELPNVYCKLSGLVTEAINAEAVARLKPYVDHLYQCFGSARLMWGSDWPVVQLAPACNSYSEWLDYAQRLVPFASKAELDDVFINTATNFYRL